MKRWSNILFVIALVVALVGCGNGDNPTQNNNSTQSNHATQPENHNSSTPNVTTSSVSEPTTTEAGGSSERDTYAMEHFVPVRLYSETRGENIVIYADRDELIQYINRRSPSAYIDYADFLSEVRQLFPLECMEGAPFDANSRAIVGFNVDTHDMQEALIDEKGQIIFGADGGLYNIIPAGENYLAFYPKTITANYAVLIDKDGNELASTEDIVGWPKYEDGRIFTTQGNVYDGRTLVQVEARQIPNLDAYTWTEMLGNGYYAVADFSNYTHDAPGVDLMEDDIQESLKVIPSSFVKALYKDGELVTGFEYFIIRPIKPFQPDVFYLEGARGGKIMNVKTGKLYTEFGDIYTTGLEQIYLYPGLLVESINDNTTYITSESSIASHYISAWEGNRFYTDYEINKTYYYSIPQILLNDREVMDDINGDIRQMFMFSMDPAPFETDATLRQGSVYGYCEVRPGIVVVTSRKADTWIHAPNFGERVFVLFYDLQQGRRLELMGLFADEAAAKERMLEIASEAFAERYPDLYADVHNPEETFFFSSWRQMLSYDSEGLVIQFDGEDMDLAGDSDFSVYLHKNELKDYLLPEYQGLWEY